MCLTGECASLCYLLQSCFFFFLFSLGFQVRIASSRTLLMDQLLYAEYLGEICISEDKISILQLFN